MTPEAETEEPRASSYKLRNIKVYWQATLKLGRGTKVSRGDHPAEALTSAARQQIPLFIQLVSIRDCQDLLPLSQFRLITYDAINTNTTMQKVVVYAKGELEKDELHF